MGWWNRRIDALLRGLLPRSRRGRQARIKNHCRRAIDLYAGGAYANSEREFLRAIQVAREPWADAELMTLALDRIGEFYHSSGNYSRAEHLYRDSLELKQKTLGEEHRETLAGINNLALLCYAQGRNSEAERLYVRLLSLLEKSVNTDSREVATCLENLAAVLRRLGRHAESDQLRLKAREIRRPLQSS